MDARIENPLFTYPGARAALLRLRRSAEDAGLPEITPPGRFNGKKSSFPSATGHPALL